MKGRRAFFRDLALGRTVLPALAVGREPARPAAAPDAAPGAERAYWVETLRRIVEPVMGNLAANRLRERMPVECPAGDVEERRKVTHLEAVGRTLAGLAPWLELEEKPPAEREPAGRLAEQARAGLAHITEEAVPDFTSFTAGRQCLVDAAFLCHALLRAPRELWRKLDPGAQRRLVAALQSTRAITPGNNNWLLFPAMVETFLASVGAQWREEPIETALRSHAEWYRGDGAYGDGPEFHWDYYNSYVIQPFLLDVVEHVSRVTMRWAGAMPRLAERARRYAEVQERLIAPDGSYPALGRSIAYRCGAFQLLARMAMRGHLPPGLRPGQVRSALTAVIRRTLDAPGTFDEGGWLRVGLAGHQPGLAEGYISTGSLYLCTVVFLPLGVGAADPFWTEAPAEWTSRKIWSGRDLPADHALRG